MQHSSLYDVLIKQDAQGIPAAAHLAKIAAAHPYFTPAQFYLLQQMNSQDQQYSRQAAKTALLFNNPYWLQFQLQQPASPVKEAPVVAMYAPFTEESKEPETATEEPITDSTINIDEAQPSEPVEPLKPIEPIELAEPADPEEFPMPNITINLAASIKEAENENALSFEPMHLVDYFASQGIKLSDEIQPADKLGKQLKSFTEWLKTMKKVHTPDTETAAVTADISIQTLAEKSNAEMNLARRSVDAINAQLNFYKTQLRFLKMLPVEDPYWRLFVDRLDELSAKPSN